MSDNQQALVSNPFGTTIQAGTQGQALVGAESARQEAEIQSAMVIAKRFPRDRIAAMDNIIRSCSRASLAETALYAYPRGHEMVTGPSIRLAEALAQEWGNMQFGIRELSQNGGESTVESFAWDLQSNTRQTKVFQVSHKRHTKRGSYALTDPRDIYEMVANQGARRLRACILGVIPGDVVETAIKQCEVTQANTGGATEDQVKGLLSAFEGFGVSVGQIEKFLGHRIDSIIGAEVVRLRKVYTSIKDGMASVGSFFGEKDPDGEKAVSAHLRDKIAASALKNSAGDPDDSGLRSAFAAVDAEDRGQDLGQGQGQDRGQVQEPVSWPQKINGGWKDSRGVVFDGRVHGMSGKAPAVTKAGVFAKRRGCSDQLHAQIERESLEAMRPAGAVELPEKEAPETEAPGFSASEIALAIRRCTLLDDCDDVQDMLRDSDADQETILELEQALSERRERIANIGVGV